MSRLVQLWDIVIDADLIEVVKADPAVREGRVFIYLRGVVNPQYVRAGVTIDAVSDALGIIIGRKTDDERTGNSPVQEAP